MRKGNAKMNIVFQEKLHVNMCKPDVSSLHENLHYATIFCKLHHLLLHFVFASRIFQMLVKMLQCPYNAILVCTYNWEPIGHFKKKDAKFLSTYMNYDCCSFGYLTESAHGSFNTSMIITDIVDSNFLVENCNVYCLFELILIHSIHL